MLGEKTNQMPHFLGLHLVYLSMIYVVCIVFNSLKLGLYQVWDSVNMGLQTRKINILSKEKGFFYLYCVMGMLFYLVKGEISLIQCNLDNMLMVSR